VEYPDYNPASTNLPLSDAELEALDSLLAHLPGGQAMNIEALDGYLTALLVAPAPLTSRKTAAWLPTVWGGDGEGCAPFRSNRQRKDTVVTVLRHLRHLESQLSQGDDAWQPVFSVAETPEGEELVDAQDWCAGFLMGVDLDAEAWAPLFDHPEIGPALVPLVLLGGAEDDVPPAEAERLADPAVVDELSRSVPDVVLALRAAAQAG
jgi:uncharacterized protein